MPDTSTKMNLFDQVVDLVRTGTSASHFYRNMNDSLKRLYGEYTMLHYPMEGEGEHSFIEGQKNLTNFCVECLGDVGGLDMLEVGCGNGVQAKHILERFKPASVTGIDLDENNIRIASELQKKVSGNSLQFYVDNAQELKNINSGSMDAIISIESAFHYPDKKAFFEQVYRALKPGGKFLVADLITTKYTKGVGLRKLWKKRMVLHHWNHEQYKEFFSESKLKLENETDITESVIRGFKGYRDWISATRLSGPVREFFFRIFYTINAKWVIFLFNNRRKYLVFSGSKP